tara:strand:+ start:251 stop:679 length:429 start_codon:yes stop_codon:yes gene_type:complete
MAKSAVVKKSNEVVFTGIGELPQEDRKFGITASHIDAWVNEFAGGNLHNVGIRVADGINKKSWFPYEKTRTMENPDSLRGKVVWALINKSGNYTLHQCNADHGKIKARRFHALCDALNGGQSPTSKTWGTSFAELFVIPQTK